MSSKGYVEVTTFVNPHTIWVRFKDKNAEQIAFEKALAKSMAKVVPLKSGAVLSGQVCVRKDGVFTRAEVLEKVGDGYRFWLVDDGIIYEGREMYSLPGDRVFQREPFARKIGLNNVVPIEQELDIATMSQNSVIKRSWSDGTVHTARQLINESKQVVFCREKEPLTTESTSYGQIILFCKDGLPYTLLSELLEKRLLAVNEEVFNRDFCGPVTSSGISPSDEKSNRVIIPSKITIREDLESFMDGAGIGRGRRITRGRNSGLNNEDISRWLNTVKGNEDIFIDSDDTSTPQTGDEESNVLLPERTIQLKNSLDANKGLLSKFTDDVNDNEQKINEKEHFRKLIESLSSSEIDDIKPENPQTSETHFATRSKSRNSNTETVKSATLSNDWSLIDDLGKISALASQRPLAGTLKLVPAGMSTIEAPKISKQTKHTSNLANSTLAKSKSVPNNQNGTLKTNMSSENSFKDFNDSNNSSVGTFHSHNHSSTDKSFHGESSSTSSFSSLNSSGIRRPTAQSIAHSRKIAEKTGLNSPSCSSLESANNDSFAQKSQNTSNVSTLARTGDSDSPTSSAVSKSSSRPSALSIARSRKLQKATGNLSKLDNPGKSLDGSSNSSSMANNNKSSIKSDKITEKIEFESPNLAKSLEVSSKSSIANKFITDDQKIDVGLHKSADSSSNTSVQLNNSIKSDGSSTSQPSNRKPSAISIAYAKLCANKNRNGSGRSNYVQTTNSSGDGKENVIDNVQVGNTDKIVASGDCCVSKQNSAINTKNIDLIDTKNKDSTTNMEDSTINIKDSTNNIKASTNNIKASTNNIKDSTNSDIKDSTINIKDSTINIKDSTINIKDSKPKNNNTNLKDDNSSCSDDSDSTTSSCRRKRNALPDPKDEMAMLMYNRICRCENCLPWTEDKTGLGPDDRVTFIDNKKKAALGLVGKKTVPLFKRPEDKDRPVVMKSAAAMDIPLMAGGETVLRAIMPPILVHGTSIPAPADRVTQLPFSEHVHRALSRLNYREVRPIQQYTWPAIMRGHHVAMVHDKGRGKTLGYLPAMCSFVIEQGERYSELPRGNDPLVIVLCKGAEKAEEVYDLTCKLLENTGKKIKVAIAIPPLDGKCLNQFRTKNDILITTPHFLTILLHQRTFTTRRLAHLILEDADHLLLHHSVPIHTISTLLGQMVANRRATAPSVRVVVTAERWTRGVERFLGELYVAPVVCIGAPLEAVYYGRGELSVQCVRSGGDKCALLSDIIKDKFHLYKTVVVCNTIAEIEEISEIFKLNAISFEFANSTFNRHEILDVEKVWLNTVGGRHKVLICDDDTLLNHFTMRNAAILVHYSIPPTSWTTFAKRFRCTLDSYSSPLSTEKSNLNCFIYLFIDETCTKQMARLTIYLKNTGFELPKLFLELSEHTVYKSEQSKIRRKVPLCPNLKLFGQCISSSTSSACSRRHLLHSHLDRAVSTSHGHSPIGLGETVRFRILAVRDVVTCYVRVLKHDDSSVRGKPVEGDEGGERLVRGMEREMKRVVGEEGGKMVAFDVKLGGKYICTDSNDDVYRRCIVIEIVKTERVTGHAGIVKVHLLDYGTEISVVADLLFDMPKKFKKIPNLAFEVRLANILPPGNDVSWSLNLTRNATSLLTEINDRNVIGDGNSSYFTGTLLLQLGSTMWLTGVRRIRYLPATDTLLTTLIVSNTLVQHQLADYYRGESGEDPLNRLCQLCAKCQLPVPEDALIKLAIDITGKPKAGAPVKVREQVSAQWAFLEKDVGNRVFFAAGETPDRFYIRHQKFDKQLTELHETIAQAICRPFYPTAGPLTVGRYYLARDQLEDNSYLRVRVLELGDVMVECLFVDYGDVVGIPRDDIKYLRDDFITKLPFQAIECQLHGIPAMPTGQPYPPSAMDPLRNNYLEPDTDFYRVWRAFVIASSSDPADGQRRKYIIRLYDSYQESGELVVDSLNLMVSDKLKQEGIGEGGNDVTELRSESEENVLLDELEQDLYGVEEEEEEEEDNDWDHDNYVRPIPISNSPELNIEDFDCHIFDEDNFLKSLNASSPNNSSTIAPKPLKPLPAITAAPRLDHPVPMKATPENKTDYNLPSVYWHQTDNYVKLDIRIPDVKDYTVKLVRGKIINFRATTTKKYQLCLTLYTAVKPPIQHTAFGQSVRVILTKIPTINPQTTTVDTNNKTPIPNNTGDETTLNQWPRLTLSTDKYRHIKYDPDKIVPVTKPGKTRAFLDLGEACADLPDVDEFWYNEDSDYNNSESDIVSD